MKKILVALAWVSIFSGIRSSEALDIFPSKGANTALILNVQARYQQATLFTSGGNPNYSGLLYTGGLDYLIGNSAFAMGPSVSYTLGSLSNTANTSARNEELDHHVITAGLKFYYRRLYLGFSYAIYDLDSNTVTNSTSTIKMKGNGFQGEAGFSFALGSSFLLHIGGSVGKTSFTPGSSQVSEKTDYLNYGATIGLGFLLPSSGGGDSYFDNDDFAPASK